MNNQFIISSQLLSKLEKYFLSFKSSYSSYCLHTYNDLKLYSNESKLLIVVKCISTEGFLSNRFPERNSIKIINLNKLIYDKSYLSLCKKILNINPHDIQINNYLFCTSLKKLCSFLRSPKEIDLFTKL